jgi:hypothetical protein
MTSGHSKDDRRRNPRLDGTPLDVSLRPRGRLGAIEARAVDFNRHGIAVYTSAPLAKDRTIYLSLGCGDVRVDNLVGVVHNCVRQGNHYRSGIRFRLASDLQRDRLEVERVLACMEAALEAAREESA